MKPSYNSLNYQENIFPRNNLNYRRKRDNFLNSINNNISTSLSSNEKNSLYRIQYTKENNSLNRSKNRSRSRSPCFCGCHSNEECLLIPNYHCVPVYHYNPTFTQNTNSIITKNEEMNKKNDELLKEIIYLKRNLKRVENELNRTRTEKEASDFYIKELEKQISKNNINNIINDDSKKRNINSVKIRDF